LSVALGDIDKFLEWRGKGPIGQITWREGNKMRTYDITLTGKTPLLMHHDDIEWADFMDQWKNDPNNKKTSKAGDDRTPAWRWLGCCYHDDEVLTVPQANIMRSLMEGGAMVPVPGGRSGKTYKSQTQSGMMSATPYWDLLIGGATVAWADIKALKDEDSFATQREMVRALGFDLMVKRAKIGSSKHIRVRPEFPAGWQLSGQLAVWDEQITDQALGQILEYAGQYKGLCDWRPGGRTPGPYGTFEAEIKAVSNV
jgi:hypothetical protein